MVRKYLSGFPSVFTTKQANVLRFLFFLFFFLSFLVVGSHEDNLKHLLKFNGTYTI